MRKHITKHKTQSVKQVSYSWKQFDADCKKLAEDIKPLVERGYIDALYGLPRGGLLVAVRLSHLLNLRVVLMEGEANKRTIVVDDILDTGKTMEHFLLRNSRVWAMAVLHQNMDIPTLAKMALRKTIPMRITWFTYARAKNGWIVYPWETKESSKYDGTC